MKRLTKYQKRIKNKIFLQNILVVICILVLILLIYLKLKPEITGFAVKDECGPIGRTISHSIGDEEACKNVCNSACKSFEFKYHDSIFIYNNEIMCNNCTCLCKE